MKQVNYKIAAMSLLVLLALALTSPALAGDVLVITPESAVVPPMGHVQFEAQLFNQMAVPQILEQRIEWHVLPEDLGKITDDGFFMAGEKPGVGVVIATLKGVNQEFRAQARVQVGSDDRVFQHMPRLVVKPEKAALDFGDSLKFRAVIQFPAGNQLVPNLAVNWTVKPFTLGRIRQDGMFYASRMPGVGKIIAYAEYMGMRISGEAEVVVGKKATAQITGFIHDAATDRVISGVVVSAHRIGGIPWSRRTLSDENGAYVLDKLIPGYYVIRAEKETYLTEYYDGVHYLQEATPIQLAEGDSIGQIDFALDHGGAIAGTVFSDPDSVVLGGVHVFAYLKVKPERRFHALTSNTGEYVISGLLSGSYVVVANKEGFDGEYFDDAQTEWGATLVAVTDPDTTSGIDFALRPRSAISGTVVSDVDGSPIEGAIVIAKPLNSPSWLLAKRAKTDENGHYIMQLPVGFYLVQATADSFNGEFYNDTYDPALATPVRVTEGEHTAGIDFSLAPLSAITGVVTDQTTGDPIPGTVVWAFPEIGNQTPVRARTNAAGEFVLTNLKPGIYFVKANAENYYPEFYQEAATLHDATPVSVGYSEVIENIDFTLMRASSIQGIVLDDQGNVLPERALVVAKLVDGGYERTAVTNEAGEYVLEGLRSGSYYVMAIARGYQREFFDNASTLQDATPVEVGESEMVTGIHFSLTPISGNEGAIAGLIVSDTDSLPIPNAFVAAIPARGGKPYFGVTGPDGYYKLPGMLSGKYFVMAYAPGFIGEFYDDVRNWKMATLVEVTSPDVTENIDFALTPQQIGPYVLRGRIQLRGTQQPVAQALVFAYQNNRVVGFGVTDEQGNYSIMGLPAGNYKIAATAPGYFQNTDGDPSTADSISVELNSGQEPAPANITMEFEGLTGVSENEISIPQAFGLEQNYPNPFNPETEIRFHLAEPGLVTLSVYNVLGQTVKVLLDGQKPAGEYSVRWNGTNQFGQSVPSGVYFYRIQVKNGQKIIFDHVRKMTLMR